MGLCILLMDASPGGKWDVDHFVEQSITTYLTKCRARHAATRSALLFYEMFKERKMFRQATSVLIRLTGEVGSSECLKGKTGSITKTRPGLGLEKWTFPRTDCALFLAVYPSIRPQVCVSSRSGRPSIQ